MVTESDVLFRIIIEMGFVIIRTEIVPVVAAVASMVSCFVNSFIGFQIIITTTATPFIADYSQVKRIQQTPSS